MVTSVKIGISGAAPGQCANIQQSNLMKKTALLFAGQGAQTVGMGHDFADHFPQARQRFEQVNRLLGYDLARICFDGPEAELTNTANAQPAILAVSWIAWELLKEQLPDLQFEAAAGLSLGEFGALAAADAISFDDAIWLVHQRGKFMQEACETHQGGMAAVIGLDLATVEEVCRESGAELANLNCPGQIVVSGTTEQVHSACESAKAKGAKRAMPLQVAGAYHSKLMRPAQSRLEGVLAAVPIGSPSVMVVSNVTARPHESADSIRRRVVEQVTAPVRWEESIRFLLDQKFERFIELGPGTALSGFMKRIDKTAEIWSVNTVAALSNLTHSFHSFH